MRHGVVVQFSRRRVAGCSAATWRKPLRPPQCPLNPLVTSRLRGRLQARYVQTGNIPDGSPAPDPTEPQDGDDAPKKKSSRGQEEKSQTLFKMFESAMTTLASVAALGLVGYSYTRWYKYNVLKKMENAFAPGDPVLDLAYRAKIELSGDDNSDHGWFEPEDQALLDSIINGTLQGHYYLLIGEKGTGKSSMLIEAMAKIDGEGVSMFDAHADPEIVRIRLGKALDFEYHEDNIGSLFSIRGPRDASALLDIERALNKLEKVAMKRRKEVGRPLVLIINLMHLIRDDENGKDLLELIQQRAEQWAAGNLCTMVFNSDDYWVYERLKQQGSRMKLIPVRDLNKDRAIATLRRFRQLYFDEHPEYELLERVYDQIGGRLAFIHMVAKSNDMLRSCEEICLKEKTWFYNQCWILGEEMDDDVMDQQKYASAAMVLARALVEREKEMELTYHPEKGHILPEISLHEARQIMTRADFVQDYDRINVFTIDSKAMVRADSVPMQIAFREVCSQPGFDEHLEATLERISAIESLGRTRELTLKDLWNKGSYSVTLKTARGQVDRTLVFENTPKDDDDEKD